MPYDVDTRVPPAPGVLHLFYNFCTFTSCVQSAHCREQTGLYLYLYSYSHIFFPIYRSPDIYTRIGYSLESLYRTVPV